MEQQNEKKLYKMASFLQQKKAWLLPLFLIMNIIALVGLFQININPDMEIFMPEQSVSRDVYNRSGELFGSNQQLILAINGGAVKSLDQISVDQWGIFSKVTQFLTSNQNITSFTGPINPDLNKLKNNNRSPMLQGQQALQMNETLRLRDSSVWALYSIFPATDFGGEDMKKVESFLSDEGVDYALTGNLFFQKKINDYISIVLKFLPFAAFLLILGVFRFQMGTFKKAFLSLLPAGVGALWTFGLIGWIGHEVSIITAIAPVFTVVIGSAAGLHFISHYSEFLKTMDPVAAVAKTIEMIGIPMIITTITSVGGFLSLLLMQASGISDLALSAALGIFLAGFAATLILPLIVLSGIKVKPSKDRDPSAFSLLKTLRGVPAIVIALVLAIGGASGAYFVNTNFSQLSMFKKSTSVYQNSDLIQELSGGKLPVYAIIETKLDPLSPTYAAAILDLESSLIEKGLIYSAFSPLSAVVKAKEAITLQQQQYMQQMQSTAAQTDLSHQTKNASPAQMKMMREKMQKMQNGKANTVTQHGDDQTKASSPLGLMGGNPAITGGPSVITGSEFLKNMGQGPYPANLQGAKQLFASVSQLQPALLSHYNADQKAMRLVIFPVDAEHETLEKIKAEAATLAGAIEGLSIRLTGFDFLMDDLNSTILSSLMMSLGAAILIVFIMMILVLKKWVPALVSTLPVVITIAVLLGFLGVTGIALNLITAAIFSITIGVGIDYAVHFSSAVKNYGNVDNAFEATSRPIIANSVGLAIGMSALFFSPFAIHAQLALLMWLTMIVSMFLTLTLLPVLLKKSFNESSIPVKDAKPIIEPNLSPLEDE